jgi:hypothetical protein
MEINRFTNFINNPVLYYKLDPGEPGLATPTNASQSIAKVAMHEGGNIMRFRKEASEKGGIVVYSYIFLNIKYVGSFLAATSGRSEALIIYPAEKSKNEKDNNDDKITANIINSLNKDTDKAGNQATMPDNADDKNSKISLDKNDKVAAINNQIQELENEKNRIKKNPDNGDFIKKNADDYEKMKLDEIEKKIQILKLEKQLEEQKELLTSLFQNYDITKKLIGLNSLNLTKSSEGNLIDTIV